MIWIETLSPQRRVLARQRFAADEVSVGQSYANDFVVDDATVAPRHLVIRRIDDGALIALNLDDAPGLFLDGGNRRSDTIEIDPERPFRVGQTLLRVRTDDYGGADVARQPPSSLRRVAETLVAATVMLGTYLLVIWSESAAHWRVVPTIVVGVGILASVAVWAGFWSAISRGVSSRWRFDRHFEIAAAAMVIYTLSVVAVPLIAYAISWQIDSRIYAYMWLLLGVTVFAHLWAIGPSHLLVKSAVVGVLVLGLVAFDFLNRTENMSIYGGHSETNLMPPSLKLSQPDDSATFFSKVGEIKSELEQAKRRPAGQGIIF